MRSPPTSIRLSFLLPKGVTADPGSHAPSPFGCTLDVAGPMVLITGPSREAVFAHAATLLRVLRRQTNQPHSISALLETPPRCHLGRGGRDTWHIIVGADVAFAPTSLGAEFPRTEVSGAIGREPFRRVAP